MTIKQQLKKLEESNNSLQFEVKKLKEAIILLEAKINKKPINYFSYSSSDEENDNDFFYLDNISGV